MQTPTPTHFSFEACYAAAGTPLRAGFPASPIPGTALAAYVAQQRPAPVVARNPYRTDVRLWLYVARGVEHLELGGKIDGSVQLWATDDADALAQARVVFDTADVTVERPPLPAIEAPGWEADDAARAAWGDARIAYHDARNRAFWAAIEARDGRAAA